ncbi:histidine kinase N-terminal 7TM domain-containing protein [Methanosalsum zhilinae]|uniref:histidine kinase N-terminal 7TM domain-containing protein n=1 Tax=Methanosalsum zhilinae TaxID=39669 RepID=UPI001FE09F50|nr:histidine kinase N-terminal 7TM domain-containing protein [Methanosalsum zhilinae]
MLNALLFCTVILILVSALCFKNHNKQGTNSIATLMLAGAAYSIAYFFELQSSDVFSATMWLNFQLSVIYLLPAIWLIFVLQYTGKSNSLKAPVVIAIFLVPVISMVMLSTNHIHYMFYYDLTIKSLNGLYIIDFQRGTWGYFHIIYLNLFLLAGTLLLFNEYRKSTGYYKKNYMILLVGAFFPWIALIINLLNKNPYSIDMGPFGIFIASMFFGYGIFYYKIFDPLPVVRSQIFNEMTDGIVLVDGQNRITDINRTAVDLFGNEVCIKGQPLGNLFKPFQILNGKNVGDVEHIECFSETEGHKKWIDIRSSCIKSKNGEHTGKLFIFRDITEKKTIEQKLHDNELWLRLILKNVPAVIFRCCNDPDWTMEFLDDKIEELTGYRSVDFINSTTRPYSSIIHPDDKEFVKQSIQKAIDANIFYDIEYRVITSDGSIKWVGERGKVNPKNMIDGTIFDITDKVKVRNVQKNEILLKEIHHRVKNNLQVISSLINLEKRNLNDELLEAVLTRSQTRIRSMSIAHEKLYEADDYANINMPDYVKQISDYLIQLYKQNENVMVHVNVENVNLGIDTATPVGLLLNEMITNSLKHAYPSQKSGNIYIGFRSVDDSYVFTVSDDGIGLPENIDPKKSNSLGLKLISMLTQQLHGNLHINRTRGTKFTINFKKNIE